MKELIRRGYFLDLENIPEEVRPYKEKKWRFAWVNRQFLTEIEELTVDIDANNRDVIDFGNAPLRGLLSPLNNQVYQCFWGFFPDAKAFLEHPVDIEYSKLPKEKPSEKWRTGILRQADSPYTHPSLEHTEFFIVPGPGRHSPKFHFKEIHGRAITAYLRVMINMLTVMPVIEAEVISQLVKRIRPSTPLFLKAFEVV